MRYDHQTKARTFQAGRNGLRAPRLGFTLVELLVVIGIITLLVAIAVPVTMNALNSARAFTIKSEVDAIANAIEGYRTKYGDYPPDGCSFEIFERHCRKAFPQILDSEIDLFNPAVVYSGTIPVRNDSDVSVVAGNAPVRVMEPAEALVLFLGGLSTDPQRPFTGPGGPLALIPGTNPAPFKYQYNSGRQNALYDFDNSRITTTVIDSADISGSKMTVSNDDFNFSGGMNDLLPVYLDKYSGKPLVYFDARTYIAFVDAGGFAHVNRYGSVKCGTAVPYVSDDVNTLVAPPVNYFVNKTTFQIQSPGMDGRYNEQNPDASTTFPLVTLVEHYLSSIPTKSTFQSFDNVTNFCEKTKIGAAAQAKQTAE